MKAVFRTIFLVLICLSTPIMAEAPVYDDSENFALLEEQPQAAEELPVAHDSVTINEEGNEVSDSKDDMGSTPHHTDLVNTIQALQKEIQELRGQLEVQAHELNELKQQQLSFYQDIDARLNPSAAPVKPQAVQSQSEIKQNPTPLPQETSTEASLKVHPANEIARTPPSVGTRLNPADEQISYLAAYDLIKQKQFPKATLAMEQFVYKYPHGGYSANAHYWLGELYLANKNYPAAMTQFGIVIHDFKASSKYAPSRLKMGYALAESGRVGEAKEQLIAVMKQYPDTTAAHMAKVKLETLGG